MKVANCFSSIAFLTIFILLLSAFTMQANGADKFNENYSYLWGSDHFSLNPLGTNVQLKMDQSSGAGFTSKSFYGSGYFQMRIKLPDKKTGGILTSFFLTSVPTNQDPGNHFEIDFEFTGTNGTVQTNVYNNDPGQREQSFKLWFDPSKDFHSYGFLWNPKHIVFVIDHIPVRVFKNHRAKGIGYPNKSMRVEASIWNAPWAGQVEWSQAPFIASYQGFGISGCRSAPQGDVSACASDKYRWNRKEYWELSADQKRQMNYYRRKYMTYDYCSRASTRKPECALNA